MEPRRFQVPAGVGDERGGFRWQRHGRMRHDAVDVVDPEADPLEMKGGDRPDERLGLVDQGRQLIPAWRCLEQREQIVEAGLCRLSFVDGHGSMIVVR